MSARLESLKRLYKGLGEHARKLSADGIKQRYGPKPAAQVQPAPAAEPQVSDDDMAALADGLE